MSADDVSRNRNDYKFQTEARVRLSETDAVGIVFFGSFSTYMDVGRMDYLNHLGLNELSGPVPSLAPGAVIHCDVTFVSPARYNDVLIINVRCAEVGNTSYRFEFFFEHKRDRREVAVGTVTLVWLDENFSPQPVPQTFRETIDTFEGR